MTKNNTKKTTPKKPENSKDAGADAVVERIAKRMARAGLCSRRVAETWILDGRVVVNGVKLETPAFTVSDTDKVEVDGKLIAGRERTRLWMYNKPAGLVTTDRDPEGRTTVFERLPKELPRVMSIGRLDINTEGLLLLTNDGGLARALELPSTGWLRRYRVRVHGKVDEQALANLKDGIAVDGVLYGSIEAQLDQVQGTNAWLTMSLREGKNREIKNVMSALGLSVNRLIRVSYGPFQVGDMAQGEVREIRGRTLRDQLGEKLIGEAKADFDAPIRQSAVENKPPKSGQRTTRSGKPQERRPEKIPRGQASAKNLDRLTTKPSDNRSSSGKPASKKTFTKRSASFKGRKGSSR